MGCGTSFVKYMLFFFNLLFAIVGLVMIGIGTAVLVNWTAVKEQIQGHLNVAPWLFIIIGAIVFVIAFFGCCGAIRESHCMIVTYAIFLLVIIIIQVVLAVLMFAYAQDIRNVLVKSVDKVFDTAYHTNDEASKAAFNNIQEQFNCCGKTSYTDYGAVLLPDSCCSKGFSTVGRIIGTCQVADASNVGCSDALGNFYDKWNKTIAGVAIGVACIEVIGALFALCLANSIRNMERRSSYY